MERKKIGLKQHQSSTKWKLTPKNPRLIKNIYFSEYGQHKKQQGTEEKLPEEAEVPAKETDLETPNHSIDGMEQNTTESTTMPNVEEHGTKTIEFSPIGNGDEIPNNTPQTIKDDSQTKRTSFSERIAAMVGIKPKEKEEVVAATEKGKTFGTVSTITTETNQEKKQVTQKTVGCQEKRTIGSRAHSGELGDLMTYLDQIYEKLKCSDKEYQELKKKL